MHTLTRRHPILLASLWHSAVIAETYPAGAGEIAIKSSAVTIFDGGHVMIPAATSEFLNGKTRAEKK